MIFLEYGPSCPEIDECQGFHCINGGTCIDGNAQAICVCPLGFEGSYCQHNIGNNFYQNSV